MELRGGWTTAAHDDGSNRWTVARLRRPAALLVGLDDYQDYTETTGAFRRRREPARAQGVIVFNLGPPIEIAAPDGARLRLATGAAAISGPNTRPAIAQSSGAQQGVQLTLSLTGLSAVLALPISELVNRVVPLEDVCRSGAAGLGQQLLHAASATRRAEIVARAFGGSTDASRASAGQRHVVDRVRGSDLALGAIAREIGWSRKHLTDRVRAATGLTPQSLRRLERFQRLMKRLSGESQVEWADMAQELGYFDQSHLIREFKTFAGLTPGQFLARALPDGGGLAEP